ncbi:Small GTPase like protein [Aduncisulcus paluster]|uniref:Small GTPase like protein n=1 Tax=Aduncisulcus paluster TaxID=2918883 RepID=A0ABQ5KRW5_9EUKA|nr:Small GTPase like protein [Aduncisulcus paluster]
MYKVVFLGDSLVGKTSLTLRFVQEVFRDVDTTVGAAFFTKTVVLEGSDKEVKLEIWDTAGQERYRSLTPMYYRSADCAIICYDITSQSSFSSAQQWVRELRLVTEDIIVTLCGTKVDLEEDREVEFEESKRYAEDEGLILFETSAKTGENVYKLFQAIAFELSKKELPPARGSRSPFDDDDDDPKTCPKC